MLLSPFISLAENSDENKEGLQTASAGEITRGVNVPTQRWYLVNNNYHWSAYITGNKLYSQYYLDCGPSANFQFTGKKVSASNGYYVYVYNRVNSERASFYIGKDYVENPSYDWMKTQNSVYNSNPYALAGTQYYFAIDGSLTSCTASISGEFNTPN